MDKVLSIIIPSYNMEKYLHKCLQSLVVDNLEKVQVIVVNDGSKDKTLEIAKEFQKSYPDSFTVIDKQNGNYGSCINCGLVKAIGKYVKVLDADDSFISSNFREFIEFLSNIDVDMILSDYIKVDEDDNTTDPITLPIHIPDNTIVSAEGIFRNVHRIFQMHSVTYKTSLLRSINYSQTEGISFTDQEWVFLPTAYVKTVAYFHKPVYKYLVGRIGQTIGEDFLKRQIALQKIYSKQILQYEDTIQSLGDKNQVVTYLKERLMFNLDYLYRIALLYHKNTESIQELTAFDKHIRLTSKKATEIVDSLLIHPSLSFHYAASWYKSGYTINPKLIAARFILNLKNRIKGI